MSSTSESRLTSPVTWDGLTAPDLAEACGVRTLDLHDVVDSTLDVAHKLAQDGADAGTVVLADAQKAGRGQFGRAWSSEPGRGVWCTVIERDVDLKGLEVLSIRVGLAISERLDRLAEGTVEVKWPNDLILNRSKVGGVLVEARWTGSTLGWVAIGVGINTVAPVDIPGATGLFGYAENRKPRAESREPRAENRRSVLAAIVAGTRAAAACTGHLSTDERARFQKRDALRGKRIVEPIAGVVTGIESTGALLVMTRDREERIKTGTIRMAEGR